MDKNKYFLLGAFILSVSILAGSTMISNSINHMSSSLSVIKNITVNQLDGKNVMTFPEAADYLHISAESLEFMCSDVSGVQIPCLKIDGQYVFTKQGLDKWLESTRLNLDF